MSDAKIRGKRVACLKALWRHPLCYSLGAMATAVTESTVEEAALSWLEELGHTVLHGPDIAPDMPEAERTSFGGDTLRQIARELVESVRRNVTLDWTVSEQARPLANDGQAAAAEVRLSA